MLIPTKANISTVTDMRVDTLGLLKRVKRDNFKYVFNRSTPEAVLLSMMEYERMLERLEDAEDKLVALTMVKESKGRGVSLKTAAKKYDVEI
ncbi:hypothetical protein KJ953_03565 [Patescibacteria group bacterium]|nr:hypothetical protein [Patescibacteria group bacterium]MBU1256606.1 hypothetical protein [Patescibacteria group bacterium]MBU1457510.1 hypothetical protein [Patescibacteria group bacterium]